MPRRHGAGSSGADIVASVLALLILVDCGGQPAASSATTSVAAVISQTATSAAAPTSTSSAAAALPSPTPTPTPAPSNTPLAASPTVAATVTPVPATRTPAATLTPIATATPPAATADAAAVARGKAIFLSGVGCPLCHTIDGLSHGDQGPNLTHIASHPYDSLPNDPAFLRRWLANPQAIKPGTIMPDLGLTPQQINDLVAYLETLE